MGAPFAVPVVTLRPMALDDLVLVERWLAEPHVARWFLAGSSLARELEDIGSSVRGEQAVHMLVACADGTPVGWCQWYLCADNPEWAADVAAEPGDVGVDYAIGEPAAVGQGVGTSLLASLVALVRAARPDCGVVADPEAGNMASRRILEKNGFELVALKPLESEPTNDPMAVYRLRARPDATA